MVFIYHQVPKEIFMDPDYLKIWQDNFSTETNHILDCPESNLPSLIKSKASLFTQRIKLVCPLLIKTYTTSEE